MPIGQYVFSRVDAGVTFSEAGRLATGLGGRLASVTTAAENAIFLDILSRDDDLWTVEPVQPSRHGPWIGLEQPTGSTEPLGGWQWVNGEALTFSAWHSSQPDNFRADSVGFYWDFGGEIGWGDTVEDPTSLGLVPIRSLATELAASVTDLAGTAEHDYIWCSSVANTVAGGAGDDIIDGRSGNDRLSGDAGNDRINGGSGSDRLFGGLGRDAMNGGSGSDTFIFADIAESTTASDGRDRITGFNAVLDTVDLSLIEPIAGGSANLFTFIGSAAFTDLGQLRVARSGDNTFIECNTTGGRAPDMRIQLIGLHSLDAGNFDL